MRKNELVRSIADEFGLTLGQSSAIVTFIFGTIVRLLLAGKSYQHSGFGSFITGHQKKRKIHNVNRGEYTMVPKKKTMRFLPSKTLKRRLNNPIQTKSAKASKAKRANKKRL